MSEKFEVVISGISGRFPECDRIDCFREKLYNGEDFITIDDRKWPVGYRYKLNEKQIPDATGKLKNYQDLDNVVFKLKQATALSTDITSRLAWEPAFEAIIDAGVNPYSLDGSNVGVFMSLNFSEVSEHSFDDTGPICLLLGSNKTMLSNRLSFALNLKGPSFTNFIDIHGGMESLALGYKNVAQGFADSAIVGVSSCFKDPRVSLHFIGSGLLSPDGKTRAFDDEANGYGRSDAVVCFYLQRAQEAKRSYGELKFCDFHYHGSELSTLIGCDEKYLQISLDEIYRRNGFLDYLSDIAYVEMNAYGLKKIDAIESNAVARFFNSDQEHPLMIGSIKSNVGHTEGAAGLMAVLKAILALDSGTVAPNLHLSKINSDIRSLKENKLKVVQEITKLNSHTVAINALGLFGSVGHAVIKKSPTSLAELEATEEDKLPRLLLVSGRVENDLRDVINKIETVPYSPEFVSLVNDSLGQYLPHHLYRGYTILPKSIKTINDVQVRGAENRPVWFIFSGMGSQWQGMGHGLLDLPVFAETVAKCDRVLKPKGIDIYHILTSDDPTLFHSIINAFVAITTVQIALYEVLKAVGIEPDGIIGHSHGENSCGYADGCLSLEETMLVSWTRGFHSIEMNTIKGMMAAVGKGYNDIKDTLPEGVEVACHNSASSCTLSGPYEAVNVFVDELKNEGTFAKAVDVSNIAFHSSYISSTGPTLTSRLKKVIKTPKKRSPRWISTSVPESEWNSELAECCSAEYLTNNFVNPVLFEEGCKHIPANAVCIELAPHGLLQAILKKSLPDTCANVPLTHRSTAKENLNFLLGAVGKLYIAGLDVQANNLFSSVNYPVPRGTPSISPFCTWYHDPADVLPRFLMPNLFFPLSNESICISIKEGSEYAYLSDHKINNNTLIPPAFFMYLTWWIFSYQRKEDLGSVAVVFENIYVKEILTISLQNTISVLIMVQHGTGDFEVILDDAKSKSENSKPTILMTGSITALTASEKTKVDHSHSSLDQMSVLLTRDQLYEAFKHSGYQLADAFRLLHNVYKRSSGDDYQGEVTWNRNWVTFIDALMKFQMIAHHDGKVDTFYPKRVRQLKIPASRFSTLEKGRLLTCEASTATRTLQCNGIEMRNLYCERVVVEENYNVTQYQFVSYANPECQDVREFIILCLQIAVESLSTFRNVDELVIIETTNDMLRYSSVVQRIVNCRDGIKPSVVVRSASDPALSVRSRNKSFLILADSAEYARKFDLVDNVFILAFSPFNLHSERSMRDRYLEITKQSFPDATITLLQKKRSRHIIKPIILFDNGEVRNGNGTHDQDRGHDNEEDDTTCCIVRKNVELSELLPMLTVTKDYSQERYIYVMDEETDTHTQTDTHTLKESIEHQMELNLPVLVLKRGEWGCYRNLSLAGRQGLGDEGLCTRIASSLANLDFGFEDSVAYVNVLSRPANPSDPSAVVGFAYTGSKSSSEKIAGLGTTSISGLVERDPYLVWRVPNEWSAEDAVTIPYIYAQASNLFCPPMYRSTEAKSVLINMGQEYRLTEAFVTLALHKKVTNLFVTVTNDDEVDLIRRKFPKLQPSQILRHENQSYELQIHQRTRGEGVDLVVNCLRGADNVAASLSCVSFNGYYVEAERTNLIAPNELGLYPFLKSVSFLVMRNDVSDLLELPRDIKIKLKNSIQECIDSGVVIPFKIRQHEAKTTLSTVHENVKIVKYAAAKKPLHSTPPPIKYDDKRSHIIVGEKTSACLDLLEWMVAKGARKFVVCLQTLSLASEISMRITRLREQTKATVVLTSLSRLDQREGAKQLHDETRKIAPVEAVFFVCVAGVSPKFSNLDAVVASSVHFVGICSGRLNDYERRRSRGCPAILIHGDRPARLSCLLPHLDKLFAVDGGSGSALVLYKVTNADPSIKKNEKRKVTLREYLPTDLETLSRIAEKSSDDTAFVEAISLSRKYRDCKGVYPIFVLPALHTDLLQPLYQHLHYPVFAASNIDIASTTSTARKLFDLLNAVQPSGPVTLISETWNLPLALELLNLVESAGRAFKLFAIEGNPQEWRERVTHLGPVKSKQFDQRLVDDIFHFNSYVRTSNVQGDLPFEDRVRDSVKEVLKDNLAVERIVDAAKVIRDKISDVARLQFNNRVLNNVMLLERNQPDDKSLKLSISSDIVVVGEATYRDLLKHPQTCRTINENAVFDWWGFPDTKE